MDTKTLIVVLVLPALTFISGLVVGFLRDRSKRDAQLWETAKELTLNTINDPPFEEETACKIALSVRLVYQCLKAQSSKQTEEILRLLEEQNSRPPGCRDFHGTPPHTF